MGILLITRQIDIFNRLYVACRTDMSVYFWLRMKYKFRVSSGGFARHIANGSKAPGCALPVRAVPVNFCRELSIPRMMRCGL